MFKGIIFDLDGTLLNTINDICEALNYALGCQGYSKITVNDAKKMVGSGAKVLIKRLMDYVIPEDKRSDEVSDKLYQDYMYSYDKWKANKTIPYEGMVRALNILKRRNIKLAVLSNKPHKDTVAIVNKYFKGYFDVIYGAQDNIKLKPDPEGVYEVLKLLNLPKEEVMFVGDSDIDVKTWQNAGLFGVGACYGYSGKKALIEAGAIDTINCPIEIVNYFETDLNGIILLDKPYGLTSQEAVSFVKKRIVSKKVGHAGTLDPLATGLLVVLVGEATKISDYLLLEDKSYIAKIMIGKETDTYDLEGKVINEKKVTEELPIDEILESLKGSLMLAPPMHSAIKVEGRKLYDLARQGKTIDVPEREANIYDIKRVSEITKKDGTLEFSFYCKVSKGTYIRSLCHEIGVRLNYPAYMTGLRRIASGNLSIDDAITFKDLENDNFKVINTIKALSKQKIVEIKETLFPFVTNGRIIKLPYNDEVLFLTYKDKLIAVYEKASDGSYKARRIWK